MFRGDRLKTLRRKKGLTQETLGKEVGISKSAICFYEKGSRNPSLPNILDFIAIFGVSADYFLGTEHLIKTISDDNIEYIPMTKEEILFIEELKKDKTVYNILLEDPKRGAELIKKKIG